MKKQSHKKQQGDTERERKREEETANTNTAPGLVLLSKTLKKCCCEGVIRNALQKCSYLLFFPILSHCNHKLLFLENNADCL